MKKIVFYSLILLFISCKSVKKANLPEEKVKSLVEKTSNKPTAIGTETINVLELNIALDDLK